MNSNIVPHNFNIDRGDRQKLKGHSSVVLWFTGLSGSGKSTIANKVESRLFEEGVHTFSLDGDNVRMGLNKGLGFSREDRMENLRRIAEVSKLFIDSGTVVLASFVSPLNEDRNFVREIIGEKDFLEVFVNTPVEVCESRDVKGLYKKARVGEIKNFTGINAPYEAPEHPFIEVITEEETVNDAAERIIALIKDRLEILNNE